MTQQITINSLYNYCININLYINIDIYRYILTIIYYYFIITLFIFKCNLVAMKITII